MGCDMKHAGRASETKSPCSDAGGHVVVTKQFVKAKPYGRVLTENYWWSAGTGWGAMEVILGLGVKLDFEPMADVGDGELLIGFSEDAGRAGMLVAIVTSRLEIIFGVADIRQNFRRWDRCFGNNEINRDEFCTDGCTDLHHPWRRFVRHHGMRDGRRHGAKQHSRTCKHGNKALRYPAAVSH
jgi:hypothetical protein